MYKNPRKFLVMGLWLLGTAGTHAEGSCPPGMYPNNPGSTSGVNGCNPIPGYGNQQAPQPPEQQWERRWGAVAIDSPKAIMGVAVDKRSKADASRSAVEDCQRQGGVNCEIEAAYDNQCVAVITGNGAHNTPISPALDQAIATGIKTCRDGGLANCRVYYSACSLPVRIR